jgi:hypothetical protein
MVVVQHHHLSRLVAQRLGNFVQVEPAVFQGVGSVLALRCKSRAISTFSFVQGKWRKFGRTPAVQFVLRKAKLPELSIALIPKQSAPTTFVTTEFAKIFCENSFDLRASLVCDDPTIAVDPTPG